MQRLNFYKLNIRKDFYDFKKSLITHSNNIDIGYINLIDSKDGLFFSIENYDINISKSLENNTLKVLKAKFIDVELSINSFASIEINSSKDALSDYHLLKLKGKSELVKVKVIENYRNIFIESEFSNKATFSIKIEHLDFNIINYFYDKYITPSN